MKTHLHQRTISVMLSLASLLLLPPQPVTASKPIRHSHIFNSSPSSIINSILSGVKSSKDSTIEIDASFSQLGDDSINKFIDQLIDEDREKVKIHLGLDGNQLTPRGVSQLFDRLIQKQFEHKDITSCSNETLSDSNEADNIGEHNETIKETLIEANQSKKDETKNIIDTAQLQSKELQSNAGQLNIEIDQLDISFNDIGGHGFHSASLGLLTSVRCLFEHSHGNLLVPNILIMENCGIGPAFCRSIGRGILNAFEAQKGCNHKCRPSVLRLGGNDGISDPGAVSLAAALKLAVKSDDDTQQYTHVLEELDLSSCNIGDAGAESIALALAFNPNCLSKLDLSNNKISNIGAISLGRALVEAHRKKIMNQDKTFVLNEIILDNNVEIGDEGAKVLAEAMSCGAIRCISLRSCSIKAGGAAAFGNTISCLSKQKVNSDSFEIDLSGNTLGVRPLKKKTGLKDKASSHISSLTKTLQKGWKGGLKGAGVSMGLSVESDDEAEALMEDLIEVESESNQELMQAAIRCGARSFANEILDGIKDDRSFKDCKSNLNFLVGFRRCNLEEGGVDAISAAVTEVKKRTNASLLVDVSMNSMETEVTSALLGDKNEASLLNSMAQRHLSALSVLKEARERASMSADAAMARADVEKQFQFGGFPFDDEDSDHQYDDEYY